MMKRFSTNWLAAWLAAVGVAATPSVLNAAESPPPGEVPVADAPESPEPPAPEAVETEAEAEALAVVKPGDSEGLSLNFRDTPLEDVLNYLSEAAGFVIVLDTKVTGTVNVLSHQTLTKDEAIDLLNAILVEEGFVAIRKGRILKIVDRSDAHKQDLPVQTGSDPTQIPKKDEMVHQIIPVRYADAMKLIENISPLLSDDATLSANESSNAIVMTDTLANVRRMAEIISALDTSISAISTIRVFPLQFADATELAESITELFEAPQSGRSGRGGMREMMMARFGRGGGDRGGGSTGGSTGNSEARQAASRVVAVADERTNSLVVTAPDELIPTIEQLVSEIDTNVSDIKQVRIFRLEFADAIETADLLMQLFDEDYNNQNSRNQGGRGGFGSRFGGGRGGNQQTQTSQRVLEQSSVMAVGDPRTNSVLVSAGNELMMQIAEMVGRLDADSSRKQKVFVYSLEHADVENVATILRGMFETQATASRASTRSGQTTTSRLIDRVGSGVSVDTSFTQNPRGGGTGGGARR